MRRMLCLWPPPPAPPRKGEGSEGTAAIRTTTQMARLMGTPPPCGEGPGVGAAITNA